jgi:hypothetical protein
MKRRCTDEKYKDYPNWGGRGIKVCEAWSRSFEAFLADLGHRPSPDHQIDRIDPNGDYSPENCRWATSDQQRREHKRNLRPVTVDGVTYPSISAACKVYGVRTTTVNERMKAGIPMEAAVAYKAWSVKSRRSRESYLPKTHVDRQQT